MSISFNANQQNQSGQTHGGHWWKSLRAQSPIVESGFEHLADKGLYVLKLPITLRLCIRSPSIGWNESNLKDACMCCAQMWQTIVEVHVYSLYSFESKFYACTHTYTYLQRMKCKTLHVHVDMRMHRHRDNESVHSVNSPVERIRLPKHGNYQRNHTILFKD